MPVGLSLSARAVAHGAVVLEGFLSWGRGRVWAGVFVGVGDWAGAAVVALLEDGFSDVSAAFDGAVVDVGPGGAEGFAGVATGFSSAGC